MGVKKTPFTQIKGRRILKQNGGIRKKPRWAWKKKGSAKMTNKQKGILFNLLSCVGFGCMNACVQLAGDLPSMQKCFFRNSGALLVATFIILSKHIGFSVPKAARPSLLARSIYGTIGIFCNFYAVDRLTLADANMLNRLSPFFALLSSVFLLKESIRPLHGLTMVGAFLGSLLLVALRRFRPQASENSIISIAANKPGRLDSGSFPLTSISGIGEATSRSPRSIAQRTAASICTSGE